jgi:carbamoyl-phosphate synthase large subunit
VTTDEELAHALADVEVHDPVIQEAVGTPETEFTAGVVLFDGGDVASIVMQRSLRDGNTYRARVEPRGALHEYVEKVARALRPDGPVNLQFRLDGDVPKIFEINARFSGTTPLRTRAGFNEVELCLRHLVHAEPVRQPVVELKTFLRYWDEIEIPGSHAIG